MGDSNDVELSSLCEGKSVKILKRNLGVGIQKHVDTYISKLEEMTRYFDTEEFNQLLGIIQKYRCINQEDLLYEVKIIDGLSEEKFRKVFETVFHNLGSSKVEDLNCSFPKYHIDYKGIRFHLMIGQGSAYWTTKQG